MTTKKIPVIERIMSANDKVALENRRILDEHNTHAINIMASPGAGKTSLIVSTIKALKGRRRVGAIEGDLASTVDSEKVKAAGVPAAQINTGRMCHLDANQVHDALGELPLDDIDLLFIENVGNMVCPVGFALGEHTRVAVSSVPEGDDKPHKYPTIFANVDVLVINKTDLLPHLPFDVAEFRRLAKSLNPDVRIFEVSCVTGEGLDEWSEWLVQLTES
ncbi:MAG: hydrogenase nickel incorporation protein HypB [Chloroflexota bacterium]|nr:hydrogenase nickel incorporation protein HypB [Chloroflexota bacterium]